MLVWTNWLFLWWSSALVCFGNEQKVLLLLVDGCRWDYPDTDNELKGFPKLAEMGVRAEYVTPIFPSNSYPNWYTLVTGLYAGNHGFVQNMMYDSVHGDFFFMGPNHTASVPHWWNHAEPVWITAEKNNLHASLYGWDGCQVKIKHIEPTKCSNYVYVGDVLDRVDEHLKHTFKEALDDFQQRDTKLVQIYYETVDYVGHKYGPDSSNRKEAFRNIDRMLYDVQEEITNRGLEEQVNLVVVSDHGMTLTDRTTLKIIELNDVIDPMDIKYMIYYGASSMLLPQDEKIEKVYNDITGANITGLNVYLKENIPEIYHIKNSYLTLPILLVADEGFYILGLNLPGKSIPRGLSISKGSHGYDPYKVKDMRTIFFARGPGLKKGYISPPIENVDPYNLVCNLLGIKPLKNDGSWNRVEGMLKNESTMTSYYKYMLFSHLLMIWMYSSV